MSQDPRHLEVLILRAIEDRSFVWLTDLLADDHSPAEYDALYTGAMRLAEVGRIEVWRYPLGGNKALLGPRDTLPPEEFAKYQYGKPVPAGRSANQERGALTREKLTAILSAEDLEALDDYDLTGP
jgi:hypothetical protein